MLLSKKIFLYLLCNYFTHYVSIALYQKMCHPKGRFFFDGVIKSMVLTSTTECKLLFDLCTMSHKNYLDLGVLISIATLDFLNKLLMNEWSKLWVKKWVYYFDRKLKFDSCTICHKKLLGFIIFNKLLKKGRDSRSQERTSAKFVGLTKIKRRILRNIFEKPERRERTM